MKNSTALRTLCPLGTCDCQRDLIQADPRILLLTRQEEQRLLQRLEGLESLEQLQHMQRRLHEQLGVVLYIEPSHGEVRSARGIHMRFEARPGLCRKTRQRIVAAIRRAMEQRPEIAWRLLDSFDLFGAL